MAVAMAVCVPGTVLDTTVLKGMPWIGAEITDRGDCPSHLLAVGTYVSNFLSVNWGNSRTHLIDLLWAH